MAEYRELDVYRSAHQLVLEIYAATRRFPADERYGLTSQLRRAAVSIPANLAEGAGRGSDRDFSRFLRIAASSANELESELLIARDLGFLDSGTHRGLTVRVTRTRQMLDGLRRTLKRRSSA